MAEARRRTLQRTIIGLVVSIILAILAGLKTYEAVKQTNLAKHEAAKLTPSKAEALMREGNTNGALLLMMGALSAFEDKELPDSVAIGAHQVLEQAARQTEFEIGRPSLLIKGKEGFFILEKATTRLYRFDGKSKPVPITNKETPGSPVQAAAYIEGKNQIVLVREDLSVDIIPLDKLEIIQRGKLVRPNGPQSNYKFNIQSNGWVILQTHESTDLDLTDLHGVGLSIFDTDTGASFSSFIPKIKHPPKIVDYNGSRYLVDLNNETPFVKSISAEGKALVLGKIPYSDSTEKLQLLVCLGSHNRNKKQNDKILSYYAKQSEQGWANEIFCMRLGEQILLTYLEPGERLVFRGVVLINKNGDEVNLEDPDEIPLPVENMEMIAMEPTTNILAVGINREVNLYKINYDETSYYGTSRITKEPFWYKTTPSYVSFISPDLLLTFEEEVGKVRLYPLPYQDFRPTLMRPIKDENYVLHPLNQGNCVPEHDDEIDYTAIMPDGSKLELEFDSDSYNKLIYVNNQLQKNTIELPATTCLQFSEDWSEVVVLTQSDVQVHNLNKLLMETNLNNSLRYKIPISANTAFPLKDGSLIVARDFMVERWSMGRDGIPQPSVIYRSQHSVASAEPNRDGKQLIIVEDLESGGQRSFLYSPSSHSEWFTLVENDDFISVGFTRNEGIAFRTDEKYWSIIKKLQTGTELIEEAQTELSEHCAVAKDAPIESSPCWPSF